MSVQARFGIHTIGMSSVDLAEIVAWCLHNRVGCVDLRMRTHLPSDAGLANVERALDCSDVSIRALCLGTDVASGSPDAVLRSAFATRDVANVTGASFVRYLVSDAPSAGLICELNAILDGRLLLEPHVAANMVSIVDVVRHTLPGSRALLWDTAHSSAQLTLNNALDEVGLVHLHETDSTTLAPSDITAVAQALADPDVLVGYEWTGHPRTIDECGPRALRVRDCLQFVERAEI